VGKLSYLIHCQFGKTNEFLSASWTSHKDTIVRMLQYLKYVPKQRTSIFRLWS